MPAGFWTWPGRRPNGSAIATSAPSTWCWGCCGRRQRGQPGAGGQRRRLGGGPGGAGPAGRPRRGARSAAERRRAAGLARHRPCGDPAHHRADLRPAGRWGGRSGRRPGREDGGLGGCPNAAARPTDAHQPGAVSRRRAGQGPRPGRGRPGAVAAGGGHRRPDALAQVHEQPVAAAAACLGRSAQGLPGRGRAAAGSFGVDLERAGCGLLAELRAGVP